MSTGALLEREQILGSLDAALREADERRGGQAVLIEGEPGIGKSALLGEVARSASALGFTVAQARGARLEAGFAHGITRQLFEPLLRDARDQQRFLAGAARLAAPIVLPAGEPGAPPADAGFAANHGLYWLTAELSAERPLLLIVDDAQWADSASLIFVNYLARRLEDLRVLLAVAVRPGEPGAPTAHLDALFEATGTRSVRPSPLSERATAVLVERALGAPPQSAFLRACHEVTGGNPFLLSELLHVLAAEAADPADGLAHRVRELAPPSISRSVLVRLRAMPSEALQLAQAVGVLDLDSRLREAAALAELDRERAEAAADALTQAHVLAAGRPLRFAHPILRQAVYEDLTPARRAADHARAARLFAADGGDPDRAAAHLMSAEPIGADWAVRVLRDAGRRALARGVPDVAVRLLRRALAEPPPAEQLAAMQLELGRAERLAGDAEAIARLRAAVEAATDEAERAEAARELATALATDGELQEAVAVLDAAIAGAGNRETKLLLESDLLGLSQAGDAMAAGVAPRLEHLCEGMRGETAGERRALAAYVFHRTFAGRGSSEELASLARRALSSGRLLKEVTGDHFSFYGPLIALRDSDHHDGLRALFDDVLADAHARGSASAVAATLATLSRLDYLEGRLAEAEATARGAVAAAVSSAGYRMWVPLAVSSLVVALVERGELDEADELLGAHSLAEAAPGPSSLGNTLRAARAKLRLAQGEVDAAVADTEAWLERQRTRGGLNAVGASCTLHPARPFLAAGDRDTAGVIAKEMLEVAHGWGVPGYTGSCLATLGVVTGGPEGIQQLRQGAELLERSPRRLELAHALVDHGAALRRANRRAFAQASLTRGMELAHRCGAAPLAERARIELRATGARPRKLVVTGREALTAQELRVAQMAARGLSNPEIAQALYVTRKTVETHLRHAYQKLDIRTRQQLSAALDVE